MKKNILISSAGTNSAFSTVEAIASNFKNNLSVTIIDTNKRELVSSSVFADKYYNSPSIYEPEFTNFITGLISSENIDIYLPFIDYEILIAGNLYENKRFPSSLFIQIKSPLIAEICVDKYISYLWLKKNNIHTPITYLLDETISQNEIIIKQRKGNGSQIKKINIKEINKFSKDNDLIAQDICEPPEITVDVFRNFKNNDFYFICRERIETKAGVCTKARVFIDDEIKKIALCLSDKLQLSFFCFQVMKLNNSWAVTDINPRYGAGTAMASVIGLDFYSAMIASILDMDYTKYLKNINKEFFITRQYRNILTA
jgi:carbamoylphosphate synthase large subunit